jgi:hypothetical protein
MPKHTQYDRELPIYPGACWGRMDKSLPLLEVDLPKRPPLRIWTLRSQVVAVTRCLQSGHNGAYVIVLLSWNAEESVKYAANVFNKVP